MLAARRLARELEELDAVLRQIQPALAEAQASATVEPSTESPRTPNGVETALSTLLAPAEWLLAVAERHPKLRKLVEVSLRRLMPPLLAANFLLAACSQPQTPTIVPTATAVATAPVTETPMLVATSVPTATTVPDTASNVETPTPEQTDPPTESLPANFTARLSQEEIVDLLTANPNIPPAEQSIAPLLYHPLDEELTAQQMAEQWDGSVFRLQVDDIRNLPVVIVSANHETVPNDQDWEGIRSQAQAITTQGITLTGSDILYVVEASPNQAESPSAQSETQYLVFFTGNFEGSRTLAGYVDSDGRVVDFIKRKEAYKYLGIASPWEVSWGQVVNKGLPKLEVQFLPDGRLVSVNSFGEVIWYFNFQQTQWKTLNVPERADERKQYEEYFQPELVFERIQDELDKKSGITTQDTFFEEKVGNMTVVTRKTLDDRIARSTIMVKTEAGKPIYGPWIIQIAETIDPEFQAVKSSDVPHYLQAMADNPALVELMMQLRIQAVVTNPILSSLVVTYDPSGNGKYASSHSTDTHGDIFSLIQINPESIINLQGAFDILVAELGEVFSETYKGARLLPDREVFPYLSLDDSEASAIFSLEQAHYLFYGIRSIKDWLMFQFNQGLISQNYFDGTVNFLSWYADLLYNYIQQIPDNQ